ncbi:MAG: serine/threonine protein kinase [Magnetospirillum sp.]|nr:serine/threonine protein kinase [Magnetospirillum sp.]
MERIGKYVIHKAVVTSGYSRILLCHDPDLQVPVAVKLFHPRQDSGPLSPALLLNRFLAEARLLAAFDHPHIIAVKALEQLEDGRPYFVMPYMAAHFAWEIGKDFAAPAQAAAADERDRPRKVSLVRAVGLLRQLSSALSAMHRRGMVHRAVKPSNILLNARESGSVKLCDFSMVKLPDRNLPMPDHWMGSPDYTAPEQRDNATAVTSRADVFSLGVLAYRLTTGRLPDTSRGAVDMGDDMPAALAELVKRCTDPDPSLRPGHAGEVLQRLDAVPIQRELIKPVVKIIPRRPMAPAPVPPPPVPVAEAVTE